MGSSDLTCCRSTRGDGNTSYCDRYHRAYLKAHDRTSFSKYSGLRCSATVAENWASSSIRRIRET